MLSNVIEPPYLFVYGALRRSTGTEGTRSLNAMSRFVASGRSRGSLFHLGSYPGMTVGPSDDSWVSGEVYRLNDPSSALPVLDAYEGCSPAEPSPHEFERRPVNVLLDDGQLVRAWAYVYSLDTAGKARIPSGDYLQPKSS